MKYTEQIINECVEGSDSRISMWRQFIQLANIEHMLEVGVYRGDFAAAILEKCGSIVDYYMIDPWRHLKDWNKPANEQDDIFETFFLEAKVKTEFASQKRIILRGKTTEVVEQIPDSALDFAYIDGDHTLKGISIDMLCVYPKIKIGGWLAGDDFNKTIWQHGVNFEPTLVFPFAVYFAEAVGAHIYALPYKQFLIEKRDIYSFSFIDLTGNYGDISLRNQLLPMSFFQMDLKKNRFILNIINKLKIGRKIK